MKNRRIGYICDGFDEHCSMAPGCYRRTELRTMSDGVCRHTMNPDHALNGTSKNPENELGSRFVKVNEEEDLEYYELLPGEEI